MQKRSSLDTSRGLIQEFEDIEPIIILDDISGLFDNDQAMQLLLAALGVDPSEAEGSGESHMATSVQTEASK